MQSEFNCSTVIYNHVEDDTKIIISCHIKCAQFILFTDNRNSFIFLQLIVRKPCEMTNWNFMKLFSYDLFVFNKIILFLHRNNSTKWWIDFLHTFIFTFTLESESRINVCEQTNEINEKKHINPARNYRAGFFLGFLEMKK